MWSCSLLRRWNRQRFPWKRPIGLRVSPNNTSWASSPQSRKERRRTRRLSRGGSSMHLISSPSSSSSLLLLAHFWRRERKERRGGFKHKRRGLERPERGKKKKTMWSLIFFFVEEFKTKSFSSLTFCIPFNRTRVRFFDLFSFFSIGERVFLKAFKSAF